MDAVQKQYYHRMADIDRTYLFIIDGHVGAFLTFFIGSDDRKYLTRHIPWTVVEDDPDGDTVYIDQLLVKEHCGTGVIHKEFNIFLNWARDKFPNTQRAKWVRVNASFRKHGIKKGVTSNVHIKNFKKR